MSIAGQITGAIAARKSGGWWRTSTAHCHGGGADGLGLEGAGGSGAEAEKDAQQERGSRSSRGERHGQDVRETYR